MAQICLLLTYWCPPGDRANSDWLHLAIEHAKSINAHNYAQISPASDGSFTDQEKYIGKLKRLWWCCIIRDRIMPLCMRRSIQIGRDDFDFDAHLPLNEKDLGQEVNNSEVYAVDQSSSITALTMLMIQLCVCLTDILKLVYPKAQWSPEDAWIIQEEISKTKEYRQALDDWLQRATEALTDFSAVGKSKADPGMVSNTSHLFANLLWMYYQ